MNTQDGKECGDCRDSPDRHPVRPSFAHLMKTYCKQMHNYIAPEVCFTTGSVVELPLFYTMMNLTDSDSMLSPINICAISREHGSEKMHLKGGTVLYIDATNTRPGYARLRYADGELHRHTEPTDHGPASLQVMDHMKPTAMALSSSWMNESIKQILSFPRDAVYAIRCPKWLLEAAEWRTRYRPSGWPAKELINRVISFGCHFVQKPHPSHPDDSTEWRFSFSMAELILIQSWTSHQKCIYNLLRKVKDMLRRNCNSTTLSTYNFKTLMLWESEKHDPGFWDAVSTSAALEMLLTRMVECLEDTRCPNYFIPGNNMLDHLQRVDSRSCFHAEIACLTGLINSGINNLIDMNLKFCSKCQMFGQYQESLLPLLNCVFNTRKFRNKSEQHILIKALNILLERELHHLIKGIAYQVSTMRFTKVYTRAENSNRRCESIIQLAEENFRKSLISRNVGFLPMDKVFLKQLPSEIMEVWCNSFLLHENKDCEYAEHGKTEIYRRTSIDLPDLDCSCETIATIKFLGRLFSEIAFSFPKLSHFTCSVFLANLYYNNGCVPLAAAVCDDALKNFQSLFGLEFYHYAIPVLISEKWSVVFDKHIQTVIGFYVLVKNLLHLCTSVLDEICPQLFLRYLKIRCAQSMLLSDASLNGVSEDINLFYENYNSCFHERFCRSNRSQTLICALRLSGIR